MQTHSGIATLDADVRGALLADLGSALSEHAADGIQVSYETRITSAQRH